MKKLLTILMFSNIYISCKNEKPTIKESEPEIIVETTVKEILKQVPQYILDSLKLNTDAVEGTMYNSGSSFSLSDEKSAKDFVALILPKIPNTNSKNQIGHLMFLNKGNKLLLCSVYTNGNEVFARFDIDGQSYYSVLAGQANDMFTKVQVRSAK